MVKVRRWILTDYRTYTTPYLSSADALDVYGVVYRTIRCPVKIHRPTIYTSSFWFTDIAAGIYTLPKGVYSTHSDMV